MSGATEVRLIITIRDGNLFTGSLVTATFGGAFTGRSFGFSPPPATTFFDTGFVLFSGPIIPPGTYFTVPITLSGGITPNTGTVSDFFEWTLQFRGPPVTTSFGMSAIIDGTGTFNTDIACLHGSSLISMRNGTKRLDQIKEGDEVLSGNNLDKYTKVKGVAQCWVSFLGVDHDAIIFEPGSLSPLGNNEQNEPNKQLIIDPGHPMCTKAEYLEKGYDALRPAGTYWEEFKGDKIYTKKWTDVFVQEEPSVRYDLILEEPFNTYVANGIVVRSKGYKDHRYQQFV